MGASESRGGHSGVAGAGGGDSHSGSKFTIVPGSGPIQTTPLYMLRDAMYRKRPTSVFTYDIAQLKLDKTRDDFLPKAIKKLKTIRHPSVLKFIDCRTDSSGVHLITEKVRPLTIEYLEEITPQEIIIGLYDILIALHFLHSQCHVSHNNVQLGSIFVSNGRWVLGSMEFTGTVAETRESGMTEFLAIELVPPEHINDSSASKAKGNAEGLSHAIDIWQFGKLVQSLVDYGLIQQNPKRRLDIDRMLNIDPRKRPTGESILESDFFMKDPAVSVVKYMRLKGLDKSQNELWSPILLQRIRELPPTIIEQFILPNLLTQENFAAVGFDDLYRTLFTPMPVQPIVSHELYRSDVMPFMIKLWNFRQADIRLTIFRLFEVYLKAVVLGEGGTEVLDQIILPEIQVGLQDSDVRIYLSSLCTLANAIPYALLVMADVPDPTKLKFSVKSLYEQVLIPHIMAFWISEGNNLENKQLLVEVVMSMWSSIYSLGLQNQAAVKDMSNTLTVTLVTLLKLSLVEERVELITNAMTKQSTLSNCSSAFCVSGLLKFLPQFLLDDEELVRQAAARAIAVVASQTCQLMTASAATSTTSATTSGETDSTVATSDQQHENRIRQYCEKQQSLLPPRRSIFSRSMFTIHRQESSTSMVSATASPKQAQDDTANSSNGHVHETTAAKTGSESTLLDLPSRRSSITSQDSFVISTSEASSIHRSSTSLTRPTPLANNSHHHKTDTFNPESLSTFTKPGSIRSSVDQQQRQQEVTREDNEELYTDMNDKDAEQELLKALEIAKAEMKMRQLPVVPVVTRTDAKQSQRPASSLLAMKPSDDDGWGFDVEEGVDDWGDDTALTELDSSSNSAATASTGTVAEDEATRLAKEKSRAMKEDALKQKRDQKQQEMQAKREARRLQMEQKQLQKKASASNLLSVKKVTTTSLAAPVTTPPAVVVDTGDGWDLEDDLEGIDMSVVAAAMEPEPDLFADFEVKYKAPTYVGATNASLTPATSSATKSVGARASLSRSSSVSSKQSNGSSTASAVTASIAINATKSTKATSTTISQSSSARTLLPTTPLSSTSSVRASPLSSHQPSPQSDELTPSTSPTTTTAATSPAGPTNSMTITTTTSTATATAGKSLSRPVTPSRFASAHKAANSSLNTVNSASTTSTTSTTTSATVSATSSPKLKSAPVTLKASIPAPVPTSAPVAPLAQSLLSLAADAAEGDDDGWGDDWE